MLRFYPPNPPCQGEKRKQQRFAIAEVFGLLKVAANALTNIVRDRVEQEIRDRIPVPGGIKIPGIRL